MQMSSNDDDWFIRPLVPSAMWDVACRARPFGDGKGDARLLSIGCWLAWPLSVRSLVLHAMLASKRSENFYVRLVGLWPSGQMPSVLIRRYSVSCVWLARGCNRSVDQTSAHHVVKGRSKSSNSPALRVHSLSASSTCHTCDSFRKAI